MLVIRHLNKNGANSALYRGGGSIGIIGTARAAMIVGADPDDETRRVLAMSKSNLAQMPPALAYRVVNCEEHGCGQIRWDGISDHSATELLAIPASDDERTAQDEAADFLRAYLGQIEHKATEVKKAARQEGIADTTLHRARNTGPCRLETRRLRNRIGVLVEHPLADRRFHEPHGFRTFHLYEKYGIYGIYGIYGRVTVMTEPEPERRDPVAVAIIESAHSLGFHLTRIHDQLQHIADRLGDLTDTIAAKERS